jgi:hypothetical protein
MVLSARLVSTCEQVLCKLLYNIRNSIIINCDDVSFIFHAIEYNKQTRTLEKEEYYAPQKV